MINTCKLRYLLSIVLVLLFHSGYAQTKKQSAIDRHASSVGYYTSIDSLHSKLALLSYSDSQKVRSFFYWIADHIAYDTDEYHNKVHKYPTPPYGMDSIQSHQFYENDYVSFVLNRKRAICYGYAVLFKHLCDQAKIDCIIVYGGVKTGPQVIGQPAPTHAWNAVKLKNKWYLLDACWASGYCDNSVTKFTKKLKEYYYLTSPAKLIYDHYPTDSMWTLMEKPPSKKEFENYPHLFGDKDRIKLTSASLNGVFKTRIGDTLRIEVELDGDKDVKSGGNYITGFDNLEREEKPGKDIPKQSFKREGNKLVYLYPVWSKTINTLYVSYGYEYLAAYRVRFKK